MKYLVLGLITFDVLAGNVNGYYKKNGTYVAPYQRSEPNGVVQDNYGYKPTQPSDNSWQPKKQKERNIGDYNYNQNANSINSNEDNGEHD